MLSGWIQGVVTMCTSDGNQEISSPKCWLDCLIHPLKLAWSFDLPFLAFDCLISCNKRMHIQVYTIGHAHLPFMRSVRDQDVHKIAVADRSTGHIAVTTPWNIGWTRRLSRLQRVLLTKYWEVLSCHVLSYVFWSITIDFARRNDRTKGVHGSVELCYACWHDEMWGKCELGVLEFTP